MQSVNHCMTYMMTCMMTSDAGSSRTQPWKAHRVIPTVVLVVLSASLYKYERAVPVPASIAIWRQSRSKNLLYFELDTKHSTILRLSCFSRAYLRCFAACAMWSSMNEDMKK